MKASTLGSTPTKREVWVLFTPHGIIKHTYAPQTQLVRSFYIKRGWFVSSIQMKGEAQ